MIKIKTIILTVLVSFIFTGCSTEWLESVVGDEHVSYNSGTLNFTVTAGTDYATICFLGNTSGMIYLNGVFVDQFVNKTSYTIQNLKVNEQYNVKVVSKNGNTVLSNTMEFTTSMPYIVMAGAHPMDLFDNDEKELEAVCPYPGGGYVDNTYYHIKRTDADGNVVWRTAIRTHSIRVSNEGGIAVLGQGDDESVHRIDPNTGKILYTCRPTDKKVTVNDAYPCNNGGLVIVGQRWDSYHDGEYYYFGLFDANGKVIHEETGTDASRLCRVIETTDGTYVTMGRKWGQTISLITFDAKGKRISSDSDYLEYRDLEYAYNVCDVKKDKDGTPYFLINEAIELSPMYIRTLVVKVDQKGKILWTRSLVGDMSTSAHSLCILDDNRLCVAYGQDNWIDFNTVIVTMTKDNEILRGDNLGVELDPIFITPLDDKCTQFKFVDGEGTVFYVNLDAPHEETPFVLIDGK